MALSPPSRPTPAPADGDRPLDGDEVLAKVVALPISTWRYSWDDEHVRHLGPMAQDWWAAFGLGGTDTAISCIDANGVALVAIQALHRELQALKAAHDGAGQPPRDSREEIPATE
ncbi:tail fiber domain-containing protein [Nonomuraea sp. NPDC049709]|uniref:tail fiber domain-containing protein n=1 Tax=Nonomuraea sp. NPDC049709 TaxID=3154736 RepID=UPI00343E0D9A